MRIPLILIVAALATLLSGPAMAKDTTKAQAAGTVVAYATADPSCMGSKAQINIEYCVPFYRFPVHQYMVIQVVAEQGGSFGGWSLGEYAKWTEADLIRKFQAEAAKRNISIVIGKPKAGYLLLKVLLRLTIGDDWSNTNNSSAANYSGRYISSNTNMSASSSVRDTTVRISVSPTIYRYIDADTMEVFAAPAAPIMRTESEIISASQSTSNNDNWSYRNCHYTYNSGHSESESSSGGRDPGRVRETIADGMTQIVSEETISLLLQAIPEAVQIQDYNSIMDRRAAEAAACQETPRSCAQPTEACPPVAQPCPQPVVPCEASPTPVYVQPVAAQVQSLPAATIKSPAIVQAPASKPAETNGSKVLILPPKKK